MKKFLFPKFFVHVFCLTALLAVAGIARAQESNQLQEKFSAYQSQHLQEKLFVHTDKNFYLAGEICWFRVYVADAFFNRPLPLSKLAYVEVLDKGGKPVLQTKIALKEGGGDGSLQWPLHFNAGNYTLRAYTSWMKNTDAAYFFEKAISIVNPRKQTVGTAALLTNGYTIQFFPEGGNLVAGLQSRVAFKAVDAAGRGVACHGTVANAQGDSITTFTTEALGMGSFYLTPAAGQVYKAIVVMPDSSHQLQALPAIYTDGYVMQMEDAREALTISVQSKGNSNSQLYLFAHTRGSIKTVMTTTLSEGRAQFTVSKSLLGDGITHFTIFNQLRQPVCERLFFKKPAQQLAINVSSSLPVFEQRKKISLQVLSTNEHSTPVSANMSMAVYRVDSLTKPDDADIRQYLFLLSDLPGLVESPSLYFSADSALASSAADNLMLTQGWRRFLWEQVLQSTKPAFQFAPEIKGHLIRGRVTNAAGLPVRGVECYVTVAGTRTQVQADISNDSGMVSFEMDHFYGNDEIILQTTGQKDSTVHVEVMNPYSEAAPRQQPSLMPVAPVNPGQLQQQFAAVQVQNSFSGARLQQMLLPVFDTLPFYHTPDKTYMLDDYVRFTTMEEILREYVPYVNVRKRDGVFYLPVFDLVRKEFFHVDPLVMLDGMPVFDINKLMAYDPLKIRRLDVVARIYYYGKMFFGGIVNFVTYNGDLPAYELDRRVTVLDYKTLQMEREFYAPQYGSTSAFNSRLPDFRNVLYWAPQLQTGKDGKQEVSFYSSDLPGTYAVTVQGLTADGRAGSQTILFKVSESNPLAGK
ncbi:MAG TPA: hypothetical protein VL307_09010 [Chitinophagaceae bacterium]|nr:hypothetical protein [Chitinophagaceae bacterium]